MTPSDRSLRKSELDEAIRAHIERHLGRIIETFSDRHTDAIVVHHVGPSELRPYRTLITAGMSNEPMAVPESQPDAPRQLELMMTFHEEWQPAANSPDGFGWPLLELQRLARLPRTEGTWLGWGTVVPHGTPPQPFSKDTQQCAVILAPSLLVKEPFYQLGFGNETIAFFSAIPLYLEEAALKEQQGMAALLGKLIDHDINDAVRPHRKNVAKKRFFFF